MTDRRVRDAYTLQRQQNRLTFLAWTAGMIYGFLFVYFWVMP